MSKIGTKPVQVLSGVEMLQCSTVLPASAPELPHTPPSRGGVVPSDMTLGCGELSCASCLELVEVQ